MAAIFDRSWRTQLSEGDAEAALQLARAVVQPLYEFCQRRSADSKASQQVVHRTLVRAIREIRNYDPEFHSNEIWNWVTAFAVREIEGGATSQETCRNVSMETDFPPQGGSSPDSQFIYRLEADLCVEARRNRDAPSTQVRPAKQTAHGNEIAIACPACRRAYHISPTQLGRRVRCGHCGETFEATSEAQQDHLDEKVDDRCWYVKRETETIGPYTSAELHERISTGQLAPTELVRKGEEGEWKPAVSAEGLLVPPAPPDPDHFDFSVSVVALPAPPEPRPRTGRGVRKVPERIARFEIRERLGSGSFGDVYRAYDPVLDRELAIKVATSAALGNEQARPLVLQEPKAAAKLRHPNIVAVHDAGFDGPIFYIAIDLIRGCTLRERLQRGPLDPDVAVRLVVSLAEALDYAHRSQVLHRDVKPSNIMIDVEEQALLMDFGLARIEHSTVEKAHTDRGLLGTLGYMPPEQISRDYGEIGPPSDQYSLGVVMYELLCREPPFVGPESVLVANTLRTEPPRLRDKDASIDLDLEAICLKTLAKKPDDRYGSCQECADDLRRYQKGFATRARPLGLSERFLRWSRRERNLSTALAACAALLLLLIVTLAVAAVWFRGINLELTATVAEKDESLKRETRALGKAEKARQQAEKNLAVTYFRHGHTLCDNGQIPAGLVYLVESLGLAERAEGVDANANSLASTIRLSLPTWHQELHVLRAMLPHRLGDEDQQIQCVAVTHNGRFAVTVSHARDGGAVWFWDLTKRIPQQLQDPVRTDEAVEAIALARDGKIMATVGTAVGGGSVIRLWGYNDTDAKWQVNDAWLPDARARYGAVALSPNGMRLVAAGDDGTAGVAQEWRLGTRQPACTYYQGPETPQSVEYSRDGQYLAIGTSDSHTGMGTIVVCLTNGESLWERGESLWEREVDGAVHDVTFSPDGRWLAAAISAPLKGEARFFDSKKGTVGRQLLHLSKVYAVEFSRDNKFILTASQDRSARLWDCSSGRMLGHPLWHGHAVRDVAFAPNVATDSGTPWKLLTVSDNVARLWTVAVGTPWVADRIGPTALSAAKIPAADGKSERIAVTGTMSLIAGKTQLLQSNVFPLEKLLAIQHARSGRCVAAGTDRGIVGLEDGRVLRVDWDTGEQQFLAERHAGSVLCAAVSQDDVYAATAGEDGLVMVWNLETGVLIVRMQHGDEGNVHALAFDPIKENVVLIAGVDGNVRFWNCESCEAIGRPLPHSAVVACAAYGEDGLTLAVGLVGGGQIWRRDSADDPWQRGARLEAETETLSIHVWSKRQLVASGDLQGNVRFWHVATGEPIGPNLPNQGMVTLLIGSDEDVLSGTSSGSVRRWRLPKSTFASHDRLRVWVEATTGVRLTRQQAVEQLRVEQWQEVSSELNQAGVADMDGISKVDWETYPHSVPRIRRISGESPQRRAMLQDTLRTLLSESPTFHPPTLQYLDRYLPSDTEALIGFDFRQVIAAPLTWRIGMSHNNLLSRSIEWREWIDMTGLHSLLDIHFVLLAAPRHSISQAVLHNVLPTLTVVVQGEFDVERLWIVAHAVAKSRPEGEMKFLEGPHGKPILQVQQGDVCLYAGLIEEGEREEGNTLIASVSREVVERALAALPSNRLDGEFRSRVVGVGRQRSLWFTARKEVMEPAMLASLEGWFGASKVMSVVPERIEGGITAFVDSDFEVRATYRDKQTGPETSPALKFFAHQVMRWGEFGYVNIDIELEETEVVARGHTLGSTQELPFLGDDTLQANQGFPFAGGNEGPPGQPTLLFGYWFILDKIVLPFSQAIVDRMTGSNWKPHRIKRRPRRIKRRPPVVLPSYRIISDEITARKTRLVRVSIDKPGARLPDRLQLIAGWKDLERKGRAGRLVVCYYLPGMPLDKGPWARVSRTYRSKKMLVSTWELRVPDEFRRE